MASARNYWTDDDLRRDAEFWRGMQRVYIGRLDTGPEYWAVKANIAKLRAEASETILKKTKGNQMIYVAGAVLFVVFVLAVVFVEDVEDFLDWLDE